MCRAVMINELIVLFWIRSKNATFCVVSLGFLVDNKVQLLNCLDVYEATLCL